jgi:hypothetical protein
VMLPIAGLAAGVGQVAEVGQDRGRGRTGQARISWVKIGDGPCSGRRVAGSSVAEITLAPLVQVTQHSAIAPLAPPGCGARRCRRTEAPLELVRR